MDALHTFTLRFDQEMDLKRYANGSQTFDIDAYGPGARTIELEATFAKTADTVGTGSESDAWMSDTAVDRYVRLSFTLDRAGPGALDRTTVDRRPCRCATTPARRARSAATRPSS